jgi:hypothetical protein
VRDALLYVLANFRKHARRPIRAGLDPYSSADSFDGWRGWHPDSGTPPPFALPRRWRDAARGRAGTNADTTLFAPRTWLASTGWRRHGLIGLAEAPRG